MLSELCRELRNWFDVDRQFGETTIEDGEIVSFNGSEPLTDQYIRIVGSVFNDGIYKWPVSNLHDETFNGAIWLLAIPAEVISLSKDIDEWNAKYAGVDSTAMSPYNSESFGGYSYSKSGGGSSEGGSNAGRWQSVFANRLNMWRKI